MIWKLINKRKKEVCIPGEAEGEDESSLPDAFNAKRVKINTETKIIHLQSGGGMFDNGGGKLLVDDVLLLLLNIFDKNTTKSF